MTTHEKPIRMDFNYPITWAGVPNSKMIRLLAHLVKGGGAGPDRQMVGPEVFVYMIMANEDMNLRRTFSDRLKKLPGIRRRNIQLVHVGN